MGLVKSEHVEELKGLVVAKNAEELESLTDVLNWAGIWQSQAPPPLPPQTHHSYNSNTSRVIGSRGLVV